MTRHADRLLRTAEAPSTPEDPEQDQLLRFTTGELSKPIVARIMGSVPVATRGPRTKGRLRSPPSTELCRSRKSANDGSVVGRSKLASFDHLVGAGESEGGTARSIAFMVLRFDHQLPYADAERPSPHLLDQLGAKTSVLRVGY